MAVFLDRSFSRMTGCHCQISGSINSCLFCPFPSGFMVPFNHFAYRRKDLGLVASPPLSPPCFRPPVPLPVFVLPWSAENITCFASACSFLRKSLQSCFPSHVLPLFPASAQPCLLVSFLSSLISRICSLPPFLLSVSFPQPQELQFILSSLLKLVIYLHSEATSPILSLSLPFCSSVPTFVSQVTFITHLVSRLPQSSRAGKAFGATSDVTTAGIPTTSGAPTRSQVSAVFQRLLPR